MPSKNTPKGYPLDQSPLYRLRGKGQFERVLQVQWAAVDKLLSADNYRVWLNDKGREIQQPLGWLAHVHRRIGKLLARIELPDYVYSKKGRSYADNARQHVGATPLVKTDIHRFYPSVTRAMVYRLFANDFQCAEDVAHRLADICCYQREHLPTGSALSGRVAFFAARHMFDEIAEVAAEEQCKMTTYVDDVTVSGAAATKRLLGTVRRIVSKHGLNTKQRKSRTYAARSAKAVTGAVLVGDELRLPNERHRKIWEAKQAFAKATRKERPRILRTIRGREQEAQQILISTTEK
ncbi:reverse transcriptase family protein [Ralstonia chuxiongensis]|uniref:Reverse transcriptase family protein n=1 Tax=Ralstonia chuxiongensis TaxID=2957504 RepID=A0AA41WX81_9RALS|nr:reverse transcriptase family protein [Ralstonia chuxiongensis]MCP1174488.1 reverse transcriptase family protein [Ralstonia chuxiongensis]